MIHNNHNKMGIQGFLQFIKQTYPLAIKQHINEIDNLYIDLNHILHHVCYLSKDKQDLIQRTQDYILGIIKSIKPKKRIFLSSDGPAPMAKMILQRKRRLDTTKQKDLENDLSLNLTAGTAFMSNLENYLNTFSIYIKKYFKLDTIISTIDSDEGEIKIKRQVNLYQKRYPNDTHLIYSGDSDMALLLFTCNDLSKIYQMVDKNMIIDFGQLYETHKNKFIGDTNISCQKIKYDFVFLFLMMGNDYLPNVSCIKIDDVWESYKSVLNDRKTSIVELYTNDDNQTDEINMITKIKINSEFIHHLIHNVTKKIKPFMLKRYSSIDDTTYIKEYEKYTEGIYWCFMMYLSGKCTDYKYIFEYDFKPHILGVMIILMMNNTYTIKKHQSIDIDLYGILLIPKCAKHLLSKEQNLIVEKLSVNHQVIYEEELCKTCKNYCKDLRESKNNIDSTDIGSKDEYNKLTKKYIQHKKTHTRLSYNLIDKIQKDFINIRDEINENFDLSELSEVNNYIEYKPNNYSIPNKRLF